MKKLLICVVAIDAFPSFFRDDARLSAITEAGHAVACLCPEGTGEMTREWKRGHDNVVIAEYEDTEAGVIRAVNELLDTSFDWHSHDLLIMNNTDCELAPDILASMQERMYAFDRYAIGNPRMNINGWVNLREDDVEFARDNFPAITRIPYPTSACAYVKGLQFSLFGQFNEEYHGLEASLCDFATRINEYGFDTVMLNHVFVDADTSRHQPSTVIHEGSRDYDMLSSRFKYLESMVNRFEATGRDPIDRFKDVIRRSSKDKPSILLDFSNMPPLHVGTSEYQLGLLRHLARECYRDKYDLCVYVAKASAEFHHVTDYCDNVVYEADDLGVYDLGMYAAQPTEIARQIITDQHCARMVYTMLDSILLRCSYINFSQTDAVAAAESVRCGLENCDGIISISDYSQQDVLDFFQDDEVICNKPLRRIYIADDFGDTSTGDNPLLEVPVPFDEYILLAGNPWFKHKALANAIEALKSMDEKFVVIGYGEDDFIYPNVYGCSYGFISEDVLVEMYRRCKLFVFPSVYEGFGLPIVNALKCDKNVVVSDNPLNRELMSHLAVDPNDITFFSTFSELPQAVERALSAPHVPFVYKDSWDDFARAFSEFADELIAKPLDFDFLRRRHHQYALHWQMLDRKWREIKYDTSIAYLLRAKVYEKLIESNERRLSAWRAFKQIAGIADNA